MKATDLRMKRLAGYLKPLGYGVIILPDHGQQYVEKGDTKDGYGTYMPEDCQVLCGGYNAS